jgi:mevalonate kinase
MYYYGGMSKVEHWENYLKPAEWEIVARAPGNFFLSGEHAVMFGHPAVVQALPMYFYVGLRRRITDDKIKVDCDNVYFVDCVNSKRMNNIFCKPTRFIGCQLEHLLSACGWKGVEIGFYSELPSMCGLASSGALAAALSFALHYLLEKGISRKELDLFLTRIADPNRKICNIIKDRIFAENLFPLAWCIDSLFHNHQSSGTNAFFSLLGSSDGMPAMYRQTTPRKGDVDTPIENINPSRTISKTSVCPEYETCQETSHGDYPKEYKCPDYSKELSIYSKFPYEAKGLSEEYTNASCELFHFCCSLVYSGQPKTTEMAIKSVKKRIGKVSNYFAKCQHLNLGTDGAFDVIMAYLGSISEELWSAIGLYFDTGDKQAAREIINTIGFVQSGLRNLLGISTQEIDAICRQTQLLGFEGKLTGGGKGGDVVTICLGEEWEKLVKLNRTLTDSKKSLFHLHYCGRWFVRDFVCVPCIMKTSAKRYLLSIDIRKSEAHRVKGSKMFDDYSKIVNEIASTFGGEVLAYNKTDDQRLVAFSTYDSASKYWDSLSKKLKRQLDIECWNAIKETPYDWGKLKKLDSTAEQSKWLSDVIHEMKSHKK